MVIEDGVTQGNVRSHFLMNPKEEQDEKHDEIDGIHVVNEDDGDSILTKKEVNRMCIKKVFIEEGVKV